MLLTALPQGIETETGIVSFLDLYKLFAMNPHGRRLAEQIRFAPYKPPHLSHADWERALGANVNNLRHLLESWKLIKRSIMLTVQAGMDLSESDMELLQLAAIIHDWQEAYPHIGDVISMKKEAGQHEKEMAALEQIVREVVHDPLLLRQIDRAIDDVLRDRTSRLGEIFRANEIMGHVKTGMVAWKKASAVRGSFQRHFLYVAVMVFSHQVPQLLSFLPKSMPVTWLLRKHENALTDIASLPLSEFRYFPPEGIEDEASHREGLEDQFLKATELWSARTLPEMAMMEGD